MIVACPTCAARYRIDPGSLRARGRTVRCGGCGNRWFVEQRPGPDRVIDPPPPIPPVPQAPLPAEAPSSPKEPRGAARYGRVRMLGLGAATGLLVLAGAVVARDAIVAAVPAARPVYERLSLPITLSLGLSLRDVVSGRDEQGLIVRGSIHNGAGDARMVPPLRLTLLDRVRRQVDQRDVAPPQARLAAGRSTRFEIHLPATPPAQLVRVTFADVP